MTVNYTTNLALGQPVTGTESGTWGDDVNNSVTAYLDIAVAGGLAVSITTADVTLSLTQGTSSATNIGSTTAQYAILNISGAMTAARNLILPSSSKSYIINNNTTGGFALTVKGSATSGITMVNGEKAVVAWNGSDYIKIANTSGAGSFTSLTDSGNLTFTGTGNRISGDFSNATQNNRIAFQSSTTNGTTSVNAIPNGTGTSSQFIAFAGTDMDNSSRAGLNTTSTVTQFFADKTGTGTYLPMTFLTGGSERMRIDTSGNVGIGITPTYLFEVYKSAGAVSRLSSDLSCISIIANASTDTTGPQQQFYKYRGTNVSPTIVASGDTSGRIQFYGYDGTTVQPMAEIRGVVDGTPGAGDMPGRMVFFTTPDGTATVLERMRLDNNGYLMIGYTTSNGAYKLQVNSQIFATSATIATSDRNYKENIVPLTGALSSVCALNPVQFDWKQHPVHDFDRSAPTIGFIAQEVQQTLAERPFLNSIVKSNTCVIQPEELAEDGSVINPAVTEEFLGLAESSLVALLTAAIKEQQALILSLTARIEALEAK